MSKQYKSYTQHLYHRLVMSMITLLFPILAYCQSNPQFKPNTDWKKIDSAYFTLIFPSEISKEAKYTANILEYGMKKIQMTLPNDIRKTKIILNNQTGIFNGFVQIGPRRSEFYTTHPTDFTSSERLLTLAIHETRHIYQFDNFNKSQIFSRPPFEELIFWNSIKTPLWLEEGEAVLIESILSEGGRGRNPRWLNNYRTLRLEQEHFSSMKSIHGSYRDYVPTFYSYGYLFSSYFSNTYGLDSFEKLFHPIAKKNGRLLFNRRVKKNSNKKFNTVHKEMWENIDKIWEKSFNMKTSDASTNILSPKRGNWSRYFIPQYSTYINPQWISENKIIALKLSFKNINKIVTIDTKTKSEHTILRLDNLTKNNFSYANNKIIFTELRGDIRYKKSSKKVVVIYDMSSKQKRKILDTDNYSSPSFSKNATRFVVVAQNSRNESMLLVVDSQSGEILNTLTAEFLKFWENPKLDIETNRVVAIRHTPEKKAIILWNVKDNKITEIFSYKGGILSTPIFGRNNDIIFKIDENGIDNIYSVDIQSHNVKQITDSHYGATNPSYNPKLGLLFSQHSAYGNGVSMIKDYQTNYTKEIDTPTKFNNFHTLFYDKLITEEAVIHSTKIPQKDYEIEPYSTNKNLFNFYSLSFYSEGFGDISPSFNSTEPSFLIKSRDIMNNLYMELGIKSNSANQRTYYTSISYKKHLFTTNVRFANNRRTVRFINRANVIQEDVFFENELSVGLLLPLSSNFGIWNYSLDLGIASQYINRYNHPELVNFTSDWVFPMEYSLNFKFFRDRSFTELIPKWGVGLNILHKNTHNFMSAKGTFSDYRITLYLPALFPTHGITAIYFAQNSSGSLGVGNVINNVIGQSFLKNSSIEDAVTFSYSMPLFYPDFAVGNMLYVSRIIGSQTYQALNLNRDITSSSLSLAISTEFRILHIPFPIIITSRFSQLLTANNRQNFWTFGLGVSLEKKPIFFE